MFLSPSPIIILLLDPMWSLHGDVKPQHSFHVSEREFKQTAEILDWIGLID